MVKTPTLSVEEAEAAVDSYPAPLRERLERCMERSDEDSLEDTVRSAVRFYLRVMARLETSESIKITKLVAGRDGFKPTVD